MYLSKCNNLLQDEVWCLDTSFRKKLFCENSEGHTEEIYESCEDQEASPINFLTFLVIMLIIFCISISFVIHKKKRKQMLHQANVKKLVRHGTI